jgi:prepilin-type N-terminal cleavage/methylation domain-containing protein
MSSSHPALPPQACLPSTSPSPSRRAFTIVELLVGTAVMLILSAVAFRLLQHINASQRTFTRKANLQVEARRAFDKTIEQIREGSDIVRPVLGETLPYLVFKGITNDTIMLYLEANNAGAERFNRQVFRLVSYRSDYAGAYNPANEKILLDSVRRMSFTSLSPSSVQVNVTLIHEQEEFQFLAHIGLMNLGGLP